VAAWLFGGHALDVRATVPAPWVRRVFCAREPV